MEMCVNCGARVRELPCIHCWWDEGDDLYCPHWMDEDVWRAGLQDDWKAYERRQRQIKSWNFSWNPKEREAHGTKQA